MTPALARAMRVAHAMQSALARARSPEPGTPARRWQAPEVFEIVPLHRANPVGSALQALLEDVASARGVAVDMLQGITRTADVVRARHEFFYRAATETKYSLASISGVVNRDHTAVRYGIGRHCGDNGLPSPRGYDYVADVERRMTRAVGWHRRNGR